MLYSFIQARNVFCQKILLHDVGEDITFLVFMAERIVVAAEGYELCLQAPSSARFKYSGRPGKGYHKKRNT